jgi:hypothetical protein
LADHPAVSTCLNRFLTAPLGSFIIICRAARVGEIELKSFGIFLSLTGTKNNQWEAQNLQVKWLIHKR